MASLADIDRMVRADLRTGGLDPTGARVRWCAQEDRLHAKSRRNHASVDTHRMDFAFARATAQLDAEHLRALVAHEVGHVLAMHYWEDGSEPGADRAAWEFLGVPICYDRAWPGKGLQQVCAMSRSTNPEKRPFRLPPLHKDSTMAEWNKHAALISARTGEHISGEDLRAQTLLADEILEEIFAEEDIEKWPAIASAVRSRARNPDLKLWKYNQRTGMWDLQRDVTEETAGPWLARFEADDPGETFVVAERRPVSEIEKQLRKQSRSRKKKARNPTEPTSLWQHAMAERLARGL